MSQLFLDIETVRQFKVDSNGIVAWPKPELVDIYGKRFKREIQELQLDYLPNVQMGRMVMEQKLPADCISFMEAADKHYAKNAALYAEWGKIVCIGVGVVSEGKFKVKYLCSRYEKQLLEEFATIASKVTSLVGHNSIEFDFPFLFRRMVVHGIQVPKVLNAIGKKPWEMAMDDTLKMWSGTAWNHKVSLALICETLGIESPKGDMDGTKVGEVFWGMFDGVANDELPFEKEKEALDKIGKYCVGDVIATANVFQRLNNNAIFTPDKIIYQNGLV